ncbi:MAG: hypothetical protein FD121_359 [Gallionellaceae bacterium]|nr:MAG: hypothetical protein FD121_359 [Gallionellaceae bacterium]
MAVNSINSGSNYVSQVQPQPQTHAERVTEKENDKGRDDVAKVVAAQQDAPKPTVNTQGQTVGSVISIKA